MLKREKRKRKERDSHCLRRSTFVRRPESDGVDDGQDDGDANGYNEDEAAETENKNVFGYVRIYV